MPQAVDEAQRQARLQEQRRIIENRAIREKCRDLIATGRYSEEELRRHRYMQKLPPDEQDELIWSAYASLRRNEDKPKRSICALM